MTSKWQEIRNKYVVNNVKKYGPRSVDYVFKTDGSTCDIYTNSRTHIGLPNGLSSTVT